MKTISACTMDCMDGCSLAVTTRGGKIRVSPNPDHPYTGHVICNKSATYPARFLTRPDRILTPLLRQGGGFAPISWDEALDLCAARIQALRATPEAMLHIRGYGLNGVLAGAADHLFNMLGASTTSGSLCLAAGRIAHTLDFGEDTQPPMAALAQARRIVNWGRDIARRSRHTLRIVQAARAAGTQVLTISPGGDNAEAFSDHVVRIRPGTDRFLAFALAKLAYEMGRVPPHVTERVANWAALKKLFDDDAPEHAFNALCAACGVSLDDMERIYAWYDPADPVATLTGWGLQRHLQGGETVRWINAVAVLHGHVGRSGGGIYYTGPTGHLDTGFLKPNPPARALPLAAIGRALLDADPPVAMAWINGCNVANQTPDSAAVCRALTRTPFVVAVEAFMNDTASRATLILPPALMFEREDVLNANDHPCVNHAAQVVPPAGQARSDYDIMADLGARLDPPVVLAPKDDWLRAALAHPALSGGLEELRAKGFLQAAYPEVPFADLVFSHADGLCRLVATLTPQEAADPAYPLHFLTCIRGERLHSQLTEADQRGLPQAWVSPDNPMLAAIDRQKPVYVASPLGRVLVRLELDPSLHPETVLARRGGWRAQGWGFNGIVAPREADLGGQAALYSQRVRLENGEESVLTLETV
ncbi:MAG: molybdopterin-dependent oxidoreductase [Desulfovibrionaceae bacterium]